MKQNSFVSAPRILIAVFVFAFLTLLTPTTTRADSPQNVRQMYIVQYGDTLNSIAAQYGISVESILRANGMATPRVYLGQPLYMTSGYAPAGYAPAAYGSAFVYIVQPGDTLFSIARRFGVAPYTLLRHNRLYNPNFIFAGMRLLVPRAVYSPPTYSTYSVRLGDTLSGIAIRFGTTTYALMLANNIANPNLIFAGMRLVLPTGVRSGYPPPAMGYPTVAPIPPGPASTPAAATTVAVSLQNMAFTPRAITIRVGTTVVWTNRETSNIPHTVTSGAVGAPSGMFESGTLNPGSRFQFTFTSPGTFNYYCRIHGAAMTGVVTVTP